MQWHIVAAALRALGPPALRIALAVVLTLAVVRDALPPAVVECLDRVAVEPFGSLSRQLVPPLSPVSRP